MTFAVFAVRPQSLDAPYGDCEAPLDIFGLIAGLSLYILKPSLAFWKARNMSYDLWFWRQSDTHSLSLEETVQAIVDEQAVETILPLPIGKIREKMLEAFPEADDCLNSIDWEQGDEQFQITWSECPASITANCSYSLLDNTDILNKIVDVANSFGLALYDPQNNTRYQQPDITSE